MSDLIPGELEVIKHYINNDSVVFDVGGFQGEWSQTVLEIRPECCIHIFEPSAVSFANMKKTLSEFITKEKVIPNQFCVSNNSGLSYFWEYTEFPVLSTLHKRSEVEMKRVGVVSPIKRTVAIKVTLDEYCKFKNIKHIDFLKIDVEGDEFNVLKGASNLLFKKRINHIQFEYGGCYQDSKSKLEEVFLYLKERGYIIGKMTVEGVDFIHQFLSEMEDYSYCNYLGIHQDKNIFRIQFDTTG